MAQKQNHVTPEMIDQAHTEGVVEDIEYSVAMEVFIGDDTEKGETRKPKRRFRSGLEVAAMALGAENANLPTVRKITKEVETKTREFFKNRN